MSRRFGSTMCGHNLNVASGSIVSVYSQYVYYDDKPVRLRRDGTRRDVVDAKPVRIYERNSDADMEGDEESRRTMALELENMNQHGPTCIHV